MSYIAQVASGHFSVVGIDVGEICDLIGVKLDEVPDMVGYLIQSLRDRSLGSAVIVTGKGELRAKVLSDLNGREGVEAGKVRYPHTGMVYLEVQQ